MKPAIVLVLTLSLALGAFLLVALRHSPVPDALPLAEEVPASAVVYVGIVDVHRPTPSLVERLLGPTHLREFKALLTPEVRSAAIFATLEEGGLRWGAVGRVSGLTVHRSWGAKERLDGPSLASRAEVRAAWTTSHPSNVRVWLDLETLGVSWATDDFRALALNAEGDEAKGWAIYGKGSAERYKEKAEEAGRTGRLPDATFAAGGVECFRCTAAKMGWDEHFPFDALGPAWGCVLRGEDLVFFVEVSQPVRVREALDRLNRKNYRVDGHWCLWSSNPAALEGFTPELGGNEQAAVHFDPAAAPALERLARRYKQPLRFPLAAFGALDVKMRYRSGSAEIEIAFR